MLANDFILSQRVSKRCEKLVSILWSKWLLIGLWQRTFMKWQKGVVLIGFNAAEPGR
ncbi:hypothetical protein [Weissella thailandensis]|uniref:hypothetical protein n=1 Tax=Weissella thailandensis TaxID=89061 RepID=UPI0011946DB1|nr:hypothetical protein [Weissella thailandensis]NKY90579.1 hypothetical protein [Weissella thailandensis]GEP73763.1 hypothetical protein WTH01_00100 [Weissella thailandensis]